MEYFGFAALDLELYQSLRYVVMVVWCGRRDWRRNLSSFPGRWSGRLINPVVEAFDSSTERLHNVPDVPSFVKFQLEFVNGSVNLVKAGYFGICVGDYIACAVIGILNREFGLFVELWMVSLRTLLNSSHKNWLATQGIHDRSVRNRRRTVYVFCDSQRN